MTINREASALVTTLAPAIKDRATVKPGGGSLRRLTDGVTIRRLVTHTDERGTVTELYDPRWDFHPDPLVFSYMFTIRPGTVKGWSLHKIHEDRYAVLFGRLELTLYDPRPDSSTYDEVCQIVLADHDRCLVNVPKNVWHADRNIGACDAVVVNFPTIMYDHADPDKWRLPIDSPLIPHRFPEGTTGF